MRVLSLEQAAALPFATRHLVDLGAEVVRVQSHARGAGVLNEADLTAGKLQLGLDLSAPGGPELFRRVAAGCDVVAHNFTPRVVRKYGIDFAGLKAVRPDIVYLSLTGYGTTGPWGERPLFGPGAEAASGHNWLIGRSGDRPGRPGTITYADNVCGLYATFAVLAALDQRDRSGRAVHIDISLYETAVSHLGPVLAEVILASTARPPGGPEADLAWHGSFPSANPERHVVVTATSDQLSLVAAVLSATSPQPKDLVQALGRMEADRAVEGLQGAGVPAALAVDAAELATDPHLWSRDWFAPLPWTGSDGSYRGAAGPAWGRSLGAEGESTRATGGPGQDNYDVLSRIAGLSAAEIDDLVETGVVGRPGAIKPSVAVPAELRVERGELARVDRDHSSRVSEAAAAVARRPSGPPLSAPVEERRQAQRSATRPVAIQLGGGIGVAYCTKLLADVGWDVVQYQPAGGAASGDLGPFRSSEPAGAAVCFLDQGKRSAEAGDLENLVAGADVVVGDFSPAGRARTGVEADAFGRLQPAHAVVSVSAFGLEGPRSGWAASESVVQAASGLMYLTGEFPDPPTPLAPYQAALAGGVTGAAAAVAAARHSRDSGEVRRVDVAMVEALASFTYPALSAYARAGEVPRREARVRAGLRMVETAEGWLYCAPGALAQMRMDGIAELIDEPRLNEKRFQTAEGRMANWEEFLAVFVPPFRRRTAKEWFERAAEQHMTLALVQRVEDLADCPQLRARELWRQVPGPEGTTVRVPGRPFRMEE